ncbi:MAG: polyribonucleotide nucleotidyltransferase [Saprospiraceae bacterium]|nr:polyribonucleotide nucleotidyltransferase [Saprospiraceae bacterium]
MNNPITQTITMGDGKTITIETGRLAKQADGSVLVTMGQTQLLATVVSAKDTRPGIDFFPLSVDYQEKFASNGRIPGGFLKREGKLSDYEVLTSRLIDRTLRPLFPDGYRFDTQVFITLHSADDETLPDALAGLAASAALSVSDIPFDGPISEVRVARVDGQLVINPTRSELEKADIDMIVGATAENVMMVEGEMDEISEEEMVQAIRFAHDAIRIQCEAQVELAKKVGAFDNNREFIPEEVDEALYAQVEAGVKEGILEVARGALDKDARAAGIREVRDKFFESLGEEPEEEMLAKAKAYFYKIQKKTIRNMMLDEGRRLDGRDFKQVRPIEVEAGVLHRPHGSALFTRGETQALATVTLADKKSEKMYDNALATGYERFYLHYNFPGFSTGEVRPNRGPGRREIGHGNLAQRALAQVIPNEEECPYTIRIISDVLESNGSSSMATVCGGSMALMDAGVAIKGGVSGVAMGMVSREDGKYAILTDILGDEDHLGDMDFKVTGTEKGITACQMDIKIDGLSDARLTEALMQAKAGRAHILDEMNKVISTHRPSYKGNVPKMVKLVIPGEFIGAVIGPGGKIIQEMQAETGTDITIEEIEKMGHVTISSVDQDGIDAAIAKIRGIAAVPEVGEVYEAKVVSIMPYGAFVEFMPGKQGLLHISEISWSRLASMDGVFEEGEQIKVKLLDVDKKSGKFRLSRKVLYPKPEADAEQ